MKDDSPITDTDQGEFDKLPETEPKSGNLVGVWFTDQTVWGYRGTLPVVIQFENPFITVAKMVVSRCPPCERKQLINGGENKVLRWIILPP